MQAPVQLSPEQVRLEELSASVRWAERTVDRLRRLGDFLKCGEELMRSPDSQLRCDLLFEVGYLLAEGLCAEPLWDWLQETARSAVLERQVEMRIAIFECAPDHPIFWPDVYRLWDMWFDPHARWAVYAAYWRFPRRIHRHLRSYSAFRRRCRLPVPEFSQEEFEQVLERHDGYRDGQATS